MRYYFHIKTADTQILDDNGMEFVDDAAAFQEAVRAAHEISLEIIPEAGVLNFRSIEVVDETGKCIFTLPIYNLSSH